MATPPKSYKEDKKESSKYLTTPWEGDQKQQGFDKPGGLGEDRQEFLAILGTQT